MKNILITGGAGFIGSHVALKLADKGYEVTVLDNLSPQIHGEDPQNTSPLYRSIRDRVRFLRGSVTDRNDWLRALDGQHAVIHLAAETGTGQSMYEIEKYTAVNIGGTSLMLDLLTNTKHSVEKVIVAASRAIYGEGRYLSEEMGYVYPLSRADEDMRRGDFECKYPGCTKPLRLVGTTEDSAIHPTSVYGITKQVQEQLVMTVCPAIGIAPVAFRYQNVYGPGQSLSNPYTGILSIFSTRIKNGNGINIFEDGRETRDFVYIDDVADATILGLEKASANGEAFNVGTGVATDVMTVARTLIDKYGTEVPLTVSGNYRLGDIRHNFADISKARQLLGFSPRWSFDAGIERFARWVDGQQVQADRYEDSIEEMKRKGLYKSSVPAAPSDGSGLTRASGQAADARKIPRRPALAADFVPDSSPAHRSPFAFQVIIPSTDEPPRSIRSRPSGSILLRTINDTATIPLIDACGAAFDSSS